MQLMRYPHVFSEFSLQMTSIKSITDTVFNIMEHGNEENVNKSITMMRGKSPRSNVEITKKLNFVAAILDF